MKKYRLKQWYPSLAVSWRVEDEYKYDTYSQVMTNISNIKNGVAMPIEVIIKKIELHPDFWELIEEKKPLFVTEDGVKVFDRDTIVYNVRNNTLAKLATNAVYLNKYDFEHKVFFHESNADEYIWKNKPVFSYNDIEKFQSGGEGIWYDVKAIAKERIEEL